MSRFWVGYRNQCRESGIGKTGDWRREPRVRRQLGMRPPRQGSGSVDVVRRSGDEPSSATRTRIRVAALVLIATYAVARLRNPEYWDPLDDLNLAVHEAGHLVFSAFGETMTILGGSLFQVIVPAAFVAYFARTRQRYAAAVTMSWVAVDLLNLARYIADARAQELPLLGGEDSIHDWWYLLINWDMLPRDLTIARWVHFAGVVAFLTAVVGGGWYARTGSRSDKP